MARISDQEMSRRAEEDVLRRIEADDLGLPVLPLVAARCLDLLSKPNFSMTEVARLVENDPLVAASIVRLANSAARATLEPARSVHQAVTRLGGDELRSFMYEISARPLFESHDRTIAIFGHELWTHSVAVALLARTLVRKNAGEQPEAAYLAGLLHDIGKPLMAAMLLEAERRLFNVRTRTWLFPLTWLALIEKTHRRVGIALAQAWRLPDLVVRSVRDADSYDSVYSASPANAVRMANALAKFGGIYVGDFDPALIEQLIVAGRRLFSLSEFQVEVLLKGLKDRVEERLA